MTRVERGLRVTTWVGDIVIIRQRIKILDDEGNLIKAPIIEVREKKRHDKEPLEDVKKRAEKLLEEKLREMMRK